MRDVIDSTNFEKVNNLSSQTQKKKKFSPLQMISDKAIYSYYQFKSQVGFNKRLHCSPQKIKTIQQKQIDETIRMGSLIPKGRKAILLNNNFAEKPQRYVNCLSPSTYVRPHKHVLDDQWELMCWVSGRFAALIFDDNGILQQRIELSASKTKVIEIPPDVFHSFIALEPCAYLEVRNCAYEPEIDRVYADWSPEEMSLNSTQYLKDLYNAKIGDNLSIGVLFY